MISTIIFIGCVDIFVIIILEVISNKNVITNI